VTRTRAATTGITSDAILRKLADDNFRVAEVPVFGTDDSDAILQNALQPARRAGHWQSDHSPLRTKAMENFKVTRSFKNPYHGIAIPNQIHSLRLLPVTVAAMTPTLAP